MALVLSLDKSRVTRCQFVKASQQQQRKSSSKLHILQVIMKRSSRTTTRREQERTKNCFELFSLPFLFFCNFFSPLLFLAKQPWQWQCRLSSSSRSNGWFEFMKGIAKIRPGEERKSKKKFLLQTEKINPFPKSICSSLELNLWLFP